VPPPREPDVEVQPEKLQAAAGDLAGHSIELARVRDEFNHVVGMLAEKLPQPAGQALDDEVRLWWLVLEAMAQTTAAVADATQQGAVLYEHVDRNVILPPPYPPQPRYDPRYIA
jgi:uncharacterized protein YukE